MTFTQNVLTLTDTWSSPGTCCSKINQVSARTAACSWADTWTVRCENCHWHRL